MGYLSFLYEHGATLGDPSGRQSSAIRDHVYEDMMDHPKLYTQRGCETKAWKKIQT